MRTAVALLMLGSAPLAAAAPPQLTDYARGLAIAPDGAAPLLELELPDEVYGGVTRSDLGDLRVFNAAGAAVPHALCPARERAEPVVQEVTLAVFVLRAAEPTQTGRTRIEVQSPDGARVRLLEPAAPGTAPPAAGAHILDASGSGDPLRALQLSWTDAADSPEVSIRIEASADLDRWEVVVPATTLLQLTQSGAELRRGRIELPLRSYTYLRVERADGGPALRLHGASAERVTPGVELEPRWFPAEALAGEAADALAYDAGHLAPVRFARLRLPERTSRYGVALESRPAPSSPWRLRWSGEAYRLEGPSGSRASPPARFEASADRHWRARLVPEPQGAAARPALELGYRPQRLRFLAQGAGPYTLAFGSRRAPPGVAAPCDELLADLGAGEREALLGTGRVGGSLALGGASALEPITAAVTATPLRVIVLWTVLIAGVGLLVGLALALLRRVREVPPAP